MREYCPYCRKEVDYKIEKRDLKEFRGIEINTYENVAYQAENTMKHQPSSNSPRT